MAAGPRRSSSPGGRGAGRSRGAKPARGKPAARSQGGARSKPPTGSKRPTPGRGPSAGKAGGGRSGGKGTTTGRGAAGGKAGSGRKPGTGRTPKGAAGASSRATGARRPGRGSAGGAGAKGAKGAKGAARRSGPSRSSTSAGAGGRGRSGAPPRRGPRPHDDAWDEVDRPDWGGVARRGAATLDEGNATRAWRQAVNRAREERRSDEHRPPHEGDGAGQWVRVDDVRDEAAGAVARGEAPSRSARSRRTEPDADLHPDALDDIAGAVGAKAAPRFESRLRDAARAFQRGRFPEARRTLKTLADQAPGAPSVRELYGLTLYRLGRWRDAIRELEAFRLLTGSSEQDAVLADCYRALGRYGEVERLWDELRAASPDAETVTEGRIVAAGALADQGRLDEAIALLSQGGWSLPKAPKEHHLRRAYALADLLEAAGELPRARALFERVARAAPDLTDAHARARNLR